MRRAFRKQQATKNLDRKQPSDILTVNLTVRLQLIGGHVYEISGRTLHNVSSPAILAALRSKIKQTQRETAEYNARLDAMVRPQPETLQSPPPTK